MNGHEGTLPATLGGEGWLQRTENHSEELKSGKYWTCCGLDSETAPLKAVALAVPPASLSSMRDANSALALRKPDMDRISRQFDDLVAFFENRGVRVYVLREREAPANIIFMRDLFVMTPAGAIIARPASLQRADEARLACKFLAANGFPIVGSVTGYGTFEGADCLWIGPQKVMIGVGARTNLVGARQVVQLLENMGVSAVLVRNPDRTQHLLGVVNLLDKDIAAVDGDLVGAETADVLHGAGIVTLAMGNRKELSEGRSMNFLALGNSQILAPAGPKATYRRYSEWGVEVHTLDVSEYVACAGGIGCAVGIVQRQ